MHLSCIQKPFNYQNEIRAAANLIDKDLVAAKLSHRKASLKNKCLEQMSQLMSSLNFSLLAYSLTHTMLNQTDGDKFAKTLVQACICILNTPTHTDARNEAAFHFFNTIKIHTSSQAVVTINLGDFKNTGFNDPSELEKLSKLNHLFNQIGSIDESSSVFASCLLKTHPTLQQLFARAFRNAMLEITARHNIHGASINSELLKIAELVTSSGQSISFPYI